jgi:hypothetical protein
LWLLWLLGRRRRELGVLTAGGSVMLTSPRAKGRFESEIA